MSDDDQRLVKDLLNGDQRAFRLFFDAHAQRMIAFVLRRSGFDRSVAEDVVQNAMIKAVRALSSFRGDASLYTWLCSICRSEMVDEHRRMARRVPTASLDSDASVSRFVAQLQVRSETELAATHGDATASESVVQALRQLPERYARILEWKYGDELSVDEISRQLRLSLSATESLLSRARQAFRTAWNGGGMGAASAAAHAAPGAQDD